MSTPLGPIVTPYSQTRPSALLTSTNPNSGSVISAAHAAILAILVEAGGLAVVIFIAGTDDGIASLVLLFIMGIFLLFMVMHAGEVQYIVGKLTFHGSQLGA